MVRVDGGWEMLPTFLRKHDPCRGSGSTCKTTINDVLCSLTFNNIIDEDKFTTQDLLQLDD